MSIIKRNLFTNLAVVAFLGVANTVVAQEGKVGINTESPNATLDIKAKVADGSKIEGFKTPQLTGDALKAMTAQLTADNDGLVVFVTSAVTTPDAGTEAVTLPGYYRFNFATQPSISVSQGKSFYTAKSWVRLEPTGLEIIEEGGKIGRRLVGTNPERYANIGTAAIDLSFQNNGTTDGGASGNYSVATGVGTKAIGENSFAGGQNNQATGKNAVAIVGYNNRASGINSFVGGENSNASAQSSFAIGNATTASGVNSFAGGQANQSTGKNAVAVVGYNNRASGENSFAGGQNSNASNTNSFALGNTTTASGHTSFAIGQSTTASGQNSFSGGQNSISSSQNSFAFGLRAKAGSEASAVFGRDIEVKGEESKSSFAVGQNNIIDNSPNSFVFGANSLIEPTDKENVATTGKSQNSFAGGAGSSVRGNSTMAMGNKANALGNGSFVAGSEAYANGNGSIALGFKAKAGEMTVVYNTENKPIAIESGHKPADQSIAIGAEAHTKAINSVALGNKAMVNTGHDNSVAIGKDVTTTTKDQVVIGGDTTFVSLGRLQDENSDTIVIDGACTSGRIVYNKGSFYGCAASKWKKLDN